MIGADPTTGEVGTAARYLFFGYQDDPDSFPGVVSSRIAGRMTLEATRLEEDGVTFDLEPHGANVKEGGEGDQRWWLHVPSGIEVRGLPTGWILRAALRGGGAVSVRGPGGFAASVNAQADQGRLLDELEAERGTFAGRPALRMDQGTDRVWVIHSRRRIVVVQAPMKDAAKLQLLEYLLAPTIADRVTDPATTPAAPRPTPPEPAAQPTKPTPPTPPATPKAVPADVVGTWTLDVEGSIRVMHDRLTTGLAAGTDQGALIERLSRLILRVPVTLSLQEGGVAELTFARHGVSPAPARRGTWALEEGRVAVRVAEAIEDAKEGTVAMAEAGKRLRFDWGAWTLLLQREPGK